MGYSTQFNGELKFTSELTAKQLAKVKSICGEDCRQHPEWQASHLTYMDLELTKDFSGIRWNDSEKTYDLTEKVNLLIRLMRQEWPDFGLSGQLFAQGEDFDDRWALVMTSPALAETKEIIITGQRVRCPRCECEFILEDKLSQAVPE
jgi:hypothetical protein